MRIGVRRAAIVTLVMLAATTLWIRRVDHRLEASADLPLSAARPVRLGDVVVAMRTIDAGDMIEPAFIRVVRRPARMIPDDAFSTPTTSWAALRT